MTASVELRRRPQAASRSVAEPGYLMASGRPYLRTLRGLHLRLKPDWYLEIGTNKGSSLKLAPGKSVCVDPKFIIPDNAILEKPAVLFFQQTSDEFFANPAFKAMNIRFDLAFLDGLHAFDFLLRDFMNTERYMVPGGVIVMHDTAPYRHAMTGQVQKRGHWTGDVWKVLPILRAYRPDLTITHLDCAPTGLAMITGLGSGNAALDDHYDDIVARYRGLDLADYGPARYFEEFPLVDPAGARGGETITSIEQGQAREQE